VVIEDKRSRDAIYVATRSKALRGEVEKRRLAALAREKVNAVEIHELEKLAK